jgi:hypothetical protein
LAIVNSGQGDVRLDMSDSNQSSKNKDSHFFSPATTKSNSTPPQGFQRIGEYQRSVVWTHQTRSLLVHYAAAA